MTCNNCGAPIPAGMRVCPYCHAEAEPPAQTNVFGEETSFAYPDGEYPNNEPEKAPAGDETEFAGEETEYVGAKPTYSQQNAGDHSAEQPAAEPASGTPFAVPGYTGREEQQKTQRRPAKEKASRSGKTKKKKSAKADKKKKNEKKNSLSPTRIVLLAVLAVLIVLVLLQNLGIVTF